MSETRNKLILKNLNDRIRELTPKDENNTPIPFDYVPQPISRNIESL